ncbi:unnamed protein product [Rotaria sp. Silwood2]|nr:unnamed protein product [Rotaria sp. Silwood2]CAF2924850.1 unnamed protein product [Rotaria sp. Silwood2]CAF3387577.1 unnamed protein product [Rotaria sp. Silwood2]
MKKDLRKKEGHRRHRANINKLKHKNMRLRKRIFDLEQEVKQLTSSLPMINKPSSPETPTPSPTKVFISTLSPAAKKRATLRLINEEENLPRGTVSAVRQKFGINLSNQYSPPSSTPSELEEKIINFKCRDDISKLCPNKKKKINHQQIRYRLNHLTVLHQQFKVETKTNVDYHTFLRYVPSFVVKPKVDDWGTYLCIICINPQIKFDKLNQLKSTKPITKQLVNSMPIDLNEVLNNQQSNKQLKDALHELKREKFSLTYNEWQKVKISGSSSTVSKKVPLVASIEDFIERFLLEIENLKQHLQRVHQQFKAAKEAKVDAQQSLDTVTIQIDWAENYNIRQAQEEKGILQRLN